MTLPRKIPRAPLPTGLRPLTTIPPGATLAPPRPAPDAIAEQVAEVRRLAPKSGPYAFVAAIVRLDPATGDVGGGMSMLSGSVQHAVALAWLLLSKAAEDIAEHPEEAELYATLTTALAALGVQDVE